MGNLITTPKTLLLAIMIVSFTACGHLIESNSDKAKIDSNTNLNSDTTKVTAMNYDEIISKFKSQYEYLEKYGLQITGVANLIADHNVIAVSTPFIFDRRKLPNKFMGLDVRDGISSLPPEFDNLDNNVDYIWAYQRFELYVDNHAELIRKTLEEPTMTRNEMLDALCFGDFKAQKEACIEWENEGKIPKWRGK